MNKLITDISNYTRRKVEMEKLISYEIDIKKLLNDIIISFKENKKNIKIKTKFIEGNYITFGNYEKLAQVFINIIDNAISFTPNKKSILVMFEKDGNNGLVYIVDQGPGINYQYKDKIFERFYTDRKTDEDKMHSGLGLDIARHIIKSYNGNIYLKNIKINEYEGACFVIELPIKESI